MERRTSGSHMIMGRNTSHKNVSWCMKSQISTFTFFFLFLPTFILILEDFSLKKYFPIFPIWFITKWIFLLCIKYQMHRKSHFHHPKWAMQIHNERQAWDELFQNCKSLWNVIIWRAVIKMRISLNNVIFVVDVAIPFLSLLQRSQSPPSQTFGLEHHYQGGGSLIFEVWYELGKL